MVGQSILETFKFLAEKKGLKQLFYFGVDFLWWSVLRSDPGRVQGTIRGVIESGSVACRESY